MHKLIAFHPRFWISVLVGAAIFLVLPQQLPAVSRVLVAWNCGVGLFLGLIFIWMSRLTADQIASRFGEEDESATVILLIVIFAALLSLVAIVALLSSLKQVSEIRRVAHLALAALTVIGSWSLVATMYTSVYAGMFYGADEDARPLSFPQTLKPDFWDFAYFSFTIAAACQTSDVSTTCSRIRKVVTAQTLISFLFNVSILGFAINVTAGLLGGN